jgi:predicted nucleic acid-binding protein
VIVVDASVVANALGDDGVDGAAARKALRSDPDLAAPDLIDVETVSVFRKRWLAGDLPTRRFRAAVEDLNDLPLARHPALPFMLRAYELRSNLTPYDAVYVALAEAFRCPLLTADARMATAPGARCEVRVVRA